MTTSMSAHCTAPYDPVGNFSFNNRSVCALHAAVSWYFTFHTLRGWKEVTSYLIPILLSRKEKKLSKKKALQKQHLVVEYKLNTCVSSEMNPFMVFRSDHFQFFLSIIFFCLKMFEIMFIFCNIVYITESSHSLIQIIYVFQTGLVR